MVEMENEPGSDGPMTYFFLTASVMIWIHASHVIDTLSTPLTYTSAGGSRFARGATDQKQSKWDATHRRLQGEHGERPQTK